MNTLLVVLFFVCLAGLAVGLEMMLHKTVRKGTFWAGAVLFWFCGFVAIGACVNLYEKLYLNSVSPRILENEPFASAEQPSVACEPCSCTNDVKKANKQGGE